MYLKIVVVVVYRLRDMLAIFLIEPNSAQLKIIF